MFLCPHFNHMPVLVPMNYLWFQSLLALVEWLKVVAVLWAPVAQSSLIT